MVILQLKIIYCQNLLYIRILPNDRFSMLINNTTNVSPVRQFYDSFLCGTYTIGNQWNRNSLLLDDRVSLITCGTYGCTRPVAIFYNFPTVLQRKLQLIVTAFTRLIITLEMDYGTIPRRITTVTEGNLS